MSSRYCMLNRQIFLILSAIVFTVISCNQGLNYNVLPKKANHNQDNLIWVELKQAETYEYKTGVSGEEEGVLIKKQAVYRYQAAKNYVGSDEVDIETSRSSDGVSPSTEIEIK